MLPPDLSAALESQLAGTGTRDIARASAELSDWYRSGRPQGSFRLTQLHRLAYAVVRMPATFASVSAVLEELRGRLPEILFHTQLDLCAGPATAAWAAATLFPELQSMTLLEADPGFIDLGRQLAVQAGHPALHEARWQQADLSGAVALAPHDLVTLSYGLGELPAPARGRLIDAAWNAARRALVIIEPGTPAGYATVLNARSRLIELQAPIAAPCPHNDPCPLAGTGRWCHFTQRLARTRLHRTAKGADLGYEDEKYSYVIASRESPPPHRRTDTEPAPGDQTGHSDRAVRPERAGAVNHTQARPCRLPSRQTCVLGRCLGRRKRGRGRLKLAGQTDRTARTMRNRPLPPGQCPSQPHGHPEQIAEHHVR